MRKVTKEKTIRIIVHILVWAVILGLPVYAARRFRMGSNFLLIFYTFTAINAIIFYTNYLILVPGLFFQKKRYMYYIAVIALVFFFYFISDFANQQISGFVSRNDNSEQFIRPPGEERLPRQPPRQMRRPGFIIAVPNAHLIGYASSSVFMVFLSLGLRVLEQQSKIEKMQEQLGKEKLNAELAFLKNQISPHFFFNTLNNIYSLIGINAEDSQDAVLKLSKLMRYLLYESEHGDTKLSYEIDFMKNYIDLMKLRMSEKVSLSVDFPDNYEDVNLPPLLFIPFIENAFKHGITTRSKSFINISLSFTPEVLIFKCSNSIAGERSEDRQPGIGLDNVKKRLALLFPGKHDLVIDKRDDGFRVFLNIKLS